MFATFLRINQRICLNSINVSNVRHLSQNSIGFIGLGNMGSNMAQNLMKRGHKLTVYDIHPETMAVMAEKGAQVASSPADVAEKCDRIISMLPTSGHVLQVYCGQNGVLSKAKIGSILMDSSTIDPQTSQHVFEMAKQSGVSFLDTPVSGAVPAAKEATLTFMVGARDIREVDMIKDLLLCMGKNVIHCGPVGSGEAAKICNNMMLAIAMIGTSETLNLAKKLGLDPKIMTQILNISSGRSWCSELYNPVPGIGKETLPAQNNYDGGFITELMTKDLGLAQSAATHVNSPTPMGTLSHQIYRLMLNNGYSSKDFSSVYKFFQDFDEKN